MALAKLHYVTSPVVLLSFGASRTVAACFLHQKSRTCSSNGTRRAWTLRLVLAAIITLLGQGTSYCIQSLSHPDFSVSQDNVVFIVAGILTYGYLLLDLYDNKAPVWYPYGISWTLAAILEVTISILGGLSRSNRDHFAVTRLAFQTLRSLLLIILSLSQCWHTYNERPRKLGEDDETASLLRGEANGDVVSPLSESDDELDNGFDSDEEDPEEWKEMKQRQKLRLQESGSWLNYLKDFKIFVPMLWPSRNGFIQFCLLVIGLVLIAQRILNVLVPRQLGIVIDELTAGNKNGGPWRSVGIWMFLSYLNSEAGIRLIQNLAELPVQQYAYKRLGVESFAHIMNLSMDFHNNKNSGELIRAIDQGQNLQQLLDYCCFRVPPMFIDLIIAFVYTYTLFDVYMSMILAFVGLAYVWVGAKTTVWSVKQRRNYNTTLRYEGKVQQEGISNWQTVSHFNRGKHECERYERSIEDFNKAEQKYLFSFYFGGSAQSLVMILGRLSAMGLAVYRVSQGVAPVGNLVTLTAYWRGIEFPLMDLSWSIRRLTQILTDAERLLQLFQTKQTVCDAPGAVDIRILDGHVEFEHVDFAYDARRQTLEDLSFTAKPGQTIALVGETGGGKSTILKLLYRYYDISAGAIRIDGQDIRGVTLDSLREAFGMVPQDPALFNITIMENLRYARLNATDEEVKEACRDAAIHDKIEKFPDKYESTVGERGVKLSGGELQRVAIARAILRQPKIVLLDEATSMIDAETEATIQQAFKRLSASRTTFVIAHRLSTIQHADQILVIHDGRIVERGTHDELFRQNGRYVALWSKQLSKDVQDIGEVLRGNGKKEALVDLADSGEESSTTEDDTDEEDDTFGGKSIRQRRR